MSYLAFNLIEYLAFLQLNRVVAGGSSEICETCFCAPFLLFATVSLEANQVGQIVYVINLLLPESYKQRLFSLI